VDDPPRPASRLDQYKRFPRFTLGRALDRAKQTADVVAKVMPHSPRPKVHRPLAPGGTTADILAGIPRTGGHAMRVLLVGHEPDLTRLAAGLLLAGGARAGADLPIILKKGGLIRIDFDGPPRPSAGRLVLLITPKLLRRL